MADDDDSPTDDDADRRRPTATTRPCTALRAIEPIEIQEEMERSFLDYAMSVIVVAGPARRARRPQAGAPPDPLGHARPRRPPRPPAHEVRPRHRRGHGQVPPPRRRRDLRRPGPHGPGLLSCATRSIDGHGNFGSLDDPPAAARYTECRLAPLAMHDARRHRRGHRRLRRQLLGRVHRARRSCPAGSRTCWSTAARASRWAWPPTSRPTTWARSSTPPSTCIDNPEATSDDLMQFVKGPDFPTGALIMGRQGIIDAYRTGRGSIRMRAVAEIEEGTRSDRIVITELPYQVEPRTRSSPRSASWSSHQRARGHRRRSTTSRPGNDTRIVITLKRDAPALVILNNLYKRTPLQTNFAVNTVALVDGVPRTLNLREALAAYIEPPGRGHHPALRVPPREGPGPGPHRRGPAQGARHDRRRSSPPSGPRTTRPPPATRCMADAVRVHRGPGRAHPRHDSCRRLTRLGRAELEEEMAELRRDHRRARGDPRPTTAKLRERHQGRAGRDHARSSPTPRRSEITYDLGDIDIEDLIDDEDLVVTMSAKGYIKTVAGRRLQHPGPRRPRRRRRQAQATRTTSPTSSTPRPTPTCCSSPTAAGCTGSRPTRSR